MNRRTTSNGGGSGLPVRISAGVASRPGGVSGTGVRVRASPAATPAVTPITTSSSARIVAIALPPTRSPSVFAGVSRRIRCHAPKAPSTRSSTAFAIERMP